jgi:hypothetical protein
VNAIGAKGNKMVSRARTIDSKRDQRSQTIPKSFDNGKLSGFVMGKIIEFLITLEKLGPLYSFRAG